MSGQHPNAVAGVVLAAGAGTRLRPLTTLRPKALCPVANVALLDHALARIRPHVADVAVNAHHHGDQVGRHVSDRAHLSLEQPEALGTAGALGALRGWLAGRAALVTNADTYLPGGLPEGFVTGWDGERCRLLCVPSPRADFTTDGGGVRYVGVCLLPWRLVGNLRAEPSGLYEVLWRDAELDLVVLPADATVIDCGTVGDYLAANLHASGGRTVIGAGARVLGTAIRSVIWPGARVGHDENLVGVVRAGSAQHPITALPR